MVSMSRVPLAMKPAPVAGADGGGVCTSDDASGASGAETSWSCELTSGSVRFCGSVSKMLDCELTSGGAPLLSCELLDCELTSGGAPGGCELTSGSVRFCGSVAPPCLKTGVKSKDVRAETSWSCELTSGSVRFCGSVTPPCFCGSVPPPVFEDRGQKQRLVGAIEF